MELKPFHDDAERLLRGLQPNSTPELFVVQNAGDWLKEASETPTPKMLFSEFWYEEELCILFADTNVGKSILAVQVADSISRGVPVPGFKLEADAQMVLYFDFELTKKQFEVRYVHPHQGHYAFTRNFQRAEVNPDALLPKKFDSFEAYLHYSIERAIIKTGARVLVIDNLTYLRTETERAKDALPLMKELKALKTKYELSILALAHTPKRDLSKPLTVNDLQGSKMLINFCDSSFAIGSSHNDKNIRYLKQIKQRNTDKIYDADNVCLCQVEKPANFLQFSFLNFGNEKEHLRETSRKDKEVMTEKAKELHGQGKTQREIAAELGIGIGTVNRYLK